MKLLQNLFNTRRKSSSRWDRPFLAGSAGTTVSLHQPMEQSVWVYAAVNALSSAVANVPYCISRVETEPEQDTASRRARRRQLLQRSPAENLLESGPAVDLFARPHPQLDRFLFWELLVSWLLLRGQAFVVALDDQDMVIDLGAAARRRPTRLMILPVDQVQILRLGGTLLGYNYTASQNSPVDGQRLLPSEIIHLRTANTSDFLSGISPLQVALLAATTDHAAALFLKGAMSNNADTGLVVSTDQTLSEETRKMLVEGLMARKRRGAGEADRPLIIDGGLHIEKPTMSIADMQFLEQRKFHRQEICAAFQVPQEVLGYSEDANRASASASRLNFYENRVIPLMARLAASLDPVLQSIDPALYGWFDYECLPIFAEARRARIDTAVKAWAMGIPFNDINEAYDLGFEEYPWHETGYLPFSVQPIEPTTPESPTPPTTPPPANPSDPSAPSDSPSPESPESDNPIAELQSMLRTLQSGSPHAARLTPHACSPNSAYQAALSGAIRATSGKLRKFFIGQRGRVLAQLEAAAAKALWDDMWDPAKENAELLKQIRTQLISNLEFGGAQLWQELALPDTFKLPPVEATRYLARREKLIKDINATTFDTLKNSLADGLNAGETYAQLADRVKATFKQADEMRAEMIATTEVNTAVNAGRLTGMAQAGVDGKAWNTSNLDGVRPSHVQAGMVYETGIPVDQTFRVGGYDLLHPGDASRGAPGSETINCRCFITAVRNGKSVIPTHPLSYESYLSTRQAPE